MGREQRPLYGQFRNALLRHTKAFLIYRQTGNLRAVQPLRNTKIESTVRYLGIEVDDAIEISERIDI